MPATPAFDGIGAPPDGTLVGFGNPRQTCGALADVESAWRRTDLRGRRLVVVP